MIESDKLKMESVMPIGSILKGAYYGGKIVKATAQSKPVQKFKSKVQKNMLDKRKENMGKQIDQQMKNHQAQLRVQQQNKVRQEALKNDMAKKSQAESQVKQAPAKQAPVKTQTPAKPSPARPGPASRGR